MIGEFGIVLVFLLFGGAFILVNMVVGSFLRPTNPTPEKLTTYECGEEPTGGAWVRFNNRYYIVALIFLIFEVEIAAVLPVAVVLRRWTQDPMRDPWIALWELLLFVGILGLGLVYAWVKGHLDWVRPTPKYGSKT